MFEKSLSVLKKLREKAGKPQVWCAIAVFSPTLVACYGMPYDENSNVCNPDYPSYDCIDGYVAMCEESDEYYPGTLVPASMSLQKYRVCSDGYVTKCGLNDAYEVSQIKCNDATKLYYESGNAVPDDVVQNDIKSDSDAKNG